jgi:metal-dependent amidase/aminoacylase/carboxypeptidase family protein
LLLSPLPALRRWMSSVELHSSPGAPPHEKISGASRRGSLYEPTVNDERVTARMVPVLERAADGDAILSELSGAADDVSVLLAQVPGLYFNLGIVPRSQDITKAAPNHSPDFFIDESALVVGVRALAMVTVNYLAAVKSD